MDRYLGGEEISYDVLTEDLEKAVARATFFPVVPVCSMTGVGCAELLDLAVDRLPVAAGAPLARGVHPRRRGGRRDRVRPRGPARRRDRQDHQRPVRRPAEPGPRLLRHPHRRRRRCTCPATSRRSSATRAGHEDHDEDEKVGALSYPFGRHPGARRRPWSPATSAPSAG